jgi:hypothetical protein
VGGPFFPGLNERGAGLNPLEGVANSSTLDPVISARDLEDKSQLPLCLHKVAVFKCINIFPCFTNHPPEVKYFQEIWNSSTAGHWYTSNAFFPFSD